MDNAERGLAAHGEYVTQRVCGGDCSKRVGIIHDWRKKIDSLDQREVRTDSEHTCIIAGLETHRDVGIIPARQARERLVQNLWTQLRRSTGCFNVGGQLLCVQVPSIRLSLSTRVGTTRNRYMIR